MKRCKSLVARFTGRTGRNFRLVVKGGVLLFLVMLQACVAPPTERWLGPGTPPVERRTKEAVGIDIPDRPAEYWQGVIERHTSILRIGEMRANPELLAPESYVVWLNAEVALARLALEGKRRRIKDDERRLAAEAIEGIRRQGPIFECYMMSRFSDPGMAYDMARFRSVDVTLIDQGGVAHFPVNINRGQFRSQMGEAGIEFSSVNAVFFPKHDFVTGLPILDMCGDRIRLLFTAYGTEYYCEWPLGN